MEIELDYELTEKIRHLVWRYQDKWGKELHRTDMVYCPVKAYCRLKGIKPKPKGRSLENWIIGEIGHALIQRAFENVEVEKEYEGVVMHYDVVWDNMPMEIKTTVTGILHAAQIPDEYLEQLTYGLVMSGDKEGLLLTFDLLNKLILVWRIKLSDDELEKARRRFIKRKNLILEAVKRNDPSILQPYYEECSNCPYAYKPDGCPCYRGE